MSNWHVHSDSESELFPTQYREPASGCGCTCPKLLIYIALSVHATTQACNFWACTHACALPEQTCQFSVPEAHRLLASTQALLPSFTSTVHLMTCFCRSIRTISLSCFGRRETQRTRAESLDGQECDVEVNLQNNGGAGGVFKNAALEVLRKEERLMTSGEWKRRM